MVSVLSISLLAGVAGVIVVAYFSLTVDPPPASSRGTRSGSEMRKQS